MGEWMYRPTFSWPRNWRWVASFTHWYPLDKRLGAPQSRSGQRGENSWPYRDSNSDPFVVQPIASRYTDYTNPAPFFLCIVSILWALTRFRCWYTKYSKLSLIRIREEKGSPNKFRTQINRKFNISNPKRLGPKKDYAGECQKHIQKTDPSSRQRGRPQK
jgi:hypothetical protein